MIGYVTIGSDDLTVSKPFYDTILQPLEATLLFASPNKLFYGRQGDDDMIAIALPYDKQPSGVGNGSMFGLRARSLPVVDDVYGLAMALGAVDEGAPGFRTAEMYATYFRDPFGNKVCVYHMESVAAFTKDAIEIVRKRIEEERSRSA